MKITLAQVNPIVGDINFNLQKVKDILAKYHRESDLIVFPELFLVGYPPKDLLEKSWFIERVNKAVEELKEISESFPQTGVLIGAPIPNVKSTGRTLFNSALFFYQGQIMFQQWKSLLPTYDVFDEERYFESAPEIHTIPFKNEILGITICEDAWNEPEFWLERRLYNFNPIDELAGKGATVFINISASPFYMGKEEIRYRLISNHAKKFEVPFVYVNQVGGNDDIIFDGRSMYFDKYGQPVVIFPSFQEDVRTIDTEQVGTMDLYQPQNKIASVYEALILGIKDYTRKTGFSKVVLGLSGGIDSALVCCLAKEALGKENVLGLSMPSPYSSLGSVEDSRQLAANLDIEFRVISISVIYQSYLETLTEHFAGQALDITEENIQARIRGNILMSFSNKFGYLVLSTGNKSEMAVGYCTLYGDMSGGLSVISDIPKTMVYELARYINRESEIIPQAIIGKAPSAELRPNQTDQDTLPPYPILDRILSCYIEEGLSADEIIALNFDPVMVNWVIKMVNKNEYKRKQAAPGLKVTPKAFGVGRRMPIAAKY